MLLICRGNLYLNIYLCEYVTSWCRAFQSRYEFPHVPFLALAPRHALLRDLQVITAERSRLYVSSGFARWAVDCWDINQQISMTGGPLPKPEDLFYYLNQL